MGNKAIKPPTVQFVRSEGNGLQTVGQIVAVIGVIASLLVLFMGGSPLVHLLLPIGLLVAILGYVQQIAAATSASYLLAMNVSRSVEDPNES